jgi:hypothetical protein
MRRAVALLAAAGLLAALVPAVSAGRAIKTEVHATSIYCDFLEGAAGTVFLGIAIDDLAGGDGWFEAWSGEPFDGPPDLVRDWEQPITGTTTATTLDATIPLVDAAGDPAGSAVVDAVLEPMGEPSTGWRDRIGNRISRAEGTFQPLSVTGTLTVGPAVYDLAPGCYGDRVDAAFFDTNPNAFVESFRDKSAGCDVSDGTTSGTVFFSFGDEDVYVDLWLDEGPGTPLGGFGYGSFVGGTGTATLELYDPETGEVLPQTGTVTVSATAGDRYSFRTGNGTVMETVSGELLYLDGTLAIEGGPTFDLGSCVGLDGRTKLVFTNPQGPKPGGKAPANDLPAKATTLRVPSTATAATKGATPDAEASFECMTFSDGGETFEVPVRHTVWYRVQGTGGTVTVDTAGSNFDTVAAAYTAAGGAYVPVPGACIDDVALEPVGRSLQAAISFATVAGTWYYVQVGGYPDEMPYGTLKVAVR